MAHNIVHLPPICPLLLLDTANYQLYVRVFNVTSVSLGAPGQTLPGRYAAMDFWVTSVRCVLLVSPQIQKIQRDIKYKINLFLK